MFDVLRRLPVEIAHNLRRSNMRLLDNGYEDRMGRGCTHPLSLSGLNLFDHLMVHSSIEAAIMPPMVGAES